MKHAAVLAVALVAVLAYANTLGHGFALDDKSVVVGNEAIRALRYAPFAFFEDYLARTPVAEDPSLYRPLATISYAIDHALHGLRPFGYHLTNVLLHALASVAALGVARRVASERAAVAAALLFAVHPIHAEAVANVAGRPELLAAIGVFTTVIAWKRLRGAWSIRAAVVCVASFALAVFSKESGVVALPLIACVELVGERKSALDRRAYLVAAALVAVLIAFLVLRAGAIGPAPIGVGLGAYPWDRRFATALRVLVEQAGQLAFPIELRAIWTEAEVPVEPALVTWRSVASASAIVAALVLAWRARTRAPAVPFGVFFFALAIAPTANVLFPIGTVRAERLLYTPSFGFCLVVAALVDALLARERMRRVFPVVVAVLVIAFGARTWIRNPAWRDDRALAEATLAEAPDSALAWALLADWHVARNELQPARDALRRHLALQPGANAWMLLGDVTRRAGDAPAAREAWERALELDPNRADALQNLSSAYLADRRPREALPLLERWCALAPESIAAQGNRIAALLATGDRARAAELAREWGPRFAHDAQFRAIADEALRGR